MLATALALLMTQGIPEFNRGSNLYRECLASVNELDGAPVLPQVTNESSRCIA